VNGHLRGLIKFSDLLDIALRSHARKDGTTDWITIYEPAIPLTENMYRNYLLYRDELLTKA
jgi:hypothetical protein